MGEANTTKLLREGLEVCIPIIVENSKKGSLQWTALLVKVCEKMLPDWKTKTRRVSPEEYKKIINTIGTSL